MSAYETGAVRNRRGETGARPRFSARPRHTRIVAVDRPMHAMLRGSDRAAILFAETDRSLVLAAFPGYEAQKAEPPAAFRPADFRLTRWLLTVYTKSARENIAVATLNALRELANHAEID